MINIDLDEIIENMDKSNIRVENLNNGWNIKVIGDFQEYELFNDQENVIISCKDIDELEDTLDCQIWVNPEEPENMDFQELEEREDEEMDVWFNRPFVRSRGDSYSVRVLDGGCHDRTTLKGIYDTLDEAIEEAKKLQGKKSEYQIMMEQIERQSE